MISVFLPTTSPSPNYYGGERRGDDRNADSLVALRASTGKVVWAFQVVHHDLWDYDLPSGPSLIEVERDGKRLAALAQPSKMGHLFILDRDTGQPVLPIEERPVPQGGVPGEWLSPTQPFPVAAPTAGFVTAWNQRMPGASLHGIVANAATRLRACAARVSHAAQPGRHAPVSWQCRGNKLRDKLPAAHAD